MCNALCRCITSSRLVSCRVAALYYAIMRPFKNLWVHEDGKCCQVSSSLFWHNVHLGLLIFGAIRNSPMVAHIMSAPSSRIYGFGHWWFVVFFRKK